MNVSTNLSPIKKILCSIIFIIILGTFFLWLPFSYKGNLRFLDCLFNATSLTCATGVLSGNFQSFTLFGKIIILLIMQLGSISILALALYLNSQNNDVNSKSLIFFIFKFTLFTELIGALFIFKLISNKHPFNESIFLSIFHSVSSFCNVGLNCFENSMTDFVYNPKMLILTSILIFAGGFGFTVWHEIFSYLKAKYKGNNFRFSITSNLILKVTPILILAFIILLFIFEHKKNFPNAPLKVVLSNIIFNAIAYRSTGLTTIELSDLRLITIIAIIIYSFIGSSPNSCGGGIKVTTFTLCFSSIKGLISDHSYTNLFQNKVFKNQMSKALKILFLSTTWIIISTCILHITEKKGKFLDIFLESVSAFTCLGFETDITLSLTSIGKILILSNMLVGRLSSLAVLLTLGNKKTPSQKENILIH